MGMLKYPRNKKHVRNTNTRALPMPHLFTGEVGSSTIFTWILWICIGLGTIFLFIIAILQLYRAIVTSNMFSVENISIHGARFLSEKDILSCSNLYYGVNSFSINIGKVEKVLRENPWIEKVSVKRRLPNKFEIFITEYKPFFWVRKNDVLHYADASGRVIVEVKPESFMVFPVLEVSECGEHMLPFAEKIVETIKNSGIIDTSAIAIFRLSKSNGIEIILENPELTMQIGAEGWKNNLEKLWAILEDISQRQEVSSIREIAVSSEGAWVRKIENI